MSTLKLLACQIEVPNTRNRADRDRHVARLAGKLDRQLAGQDMDLVVLPELATLEYSRAAFDQLEQIADPLETSTCIKSLSEVARRRNVHIAVGMPRREEARYYISIVVIAPSGSVSGYYGKVHMCQYGASMEKDYFYPGNHLFSFKINGIVIAPIICYDIRFPEITRTLCSGRDVDLILHSGAYARDESFYSWHHFAVTRAMENQCHLISLNRAGAGFGNSVYCTPWVDEHTPPVSFGTGEEFRTFIVDMQDQKVARENYTFLHDMLEDYSSL